MTLEEKLLITTSNKKQLKLLSELAMQMGLTATVVTESQIFSVQKNTEKELDETDAFHSRARHRKNPSIIKHI